MSKLNKQQHGEQANHNHGGQHLWKQEQKKAHETKKSAHSNWQHEKKHADEQHETSTDEIE